MKAFHIVEKVFAHHKQGIFPFHKLVSLLFPMLLILSLELWHFFNQKIKQYV